MTEDQYQQRRVMPESDLELNYYFTNPQWGDDTVNVQLQTQLTKTVFTKVPKGMTVHDAQGNPHISDGTLKIAENKNLWANLSYLTRDLRLANYDAKSYNYCAYFYELAGYLLNEGFKEASSICIQMAAIHGEMSQGKKGFLRRMQNTLIKEEKTGGLDVKKSSILQGKGGG